MHLTTDIFSIMNPKHIYGRKGDVVTMVSDNEHVCIVKGPDGESFAVARSELSETEVVKDTFIETTIINKLPVKKQKPVAQIQTLF